jgi:hypothetical protein
LDQKGFDRQASLAMVNIILKVIKELLPMEAQPYIDRLIHMVNNSKLYFQIGDEVLLNGETVINGVPSGWKWTALIDDLINLGEFLIAARLANIQYRNLCVMGDDTRVQVPTYEAATALLNAYKHMDIEVNQKLAIVSSTCDEFLRVVTESAGGKKFSGGYPVRILPSILYRKPGSMALPTPEQEVEVVIGNWCKLMSRCQLDLSEEMIGDINQSLGRFGIGVDAREFIHTPRLLGGFSYLPLNPEGKGLFIDKVPVWRSPIFNNKLNQIRVLTQRKIGLDTGVFVPPDRDWLASFFSDSIDSKVVGYRIEKAKMLHSHKTSVTAEDKLHRFMSDIIDGINNQEKYLPYSKGKFIPVSKMHGSGFFNNTYDELPPQDRHKLFINPEVYEMLRKQLGLNMADRMAKEGMSWMEFRQSKYELDFVGTIAAQIWCYWIDQRLNGHMSFDSVNRWISDHIMSYVDMLEFEARG